MMKLTMLIVALVALISACATGGGSPSSVAKEMWTDCNAGKYSKAESLLSADMRRVLASPMGQAAGGIKKACDSGTKNGTVTKVEILDEKIRGDGATVDARITFKDGSKKDPDVTELVRENGAWKIAAGGN